MESRIKNEILSKVMQDIQDAESFYSQEIEPKVVERYQIYNSDKNYYAKKFPKLSSRCSIASTDVADVIEWALPSLIRIFFGSEDIISIKGRTAEDDRQAEIMQKLINFQLQRLNPGFMVFYNWFKDALITGLGIVKCYWDRQYDEKEQTLVVGEYELQMARQDPNIKIKEVQDLGNGLFKVTFVYKIKTKNQPVIENVPAYEFIFNPNAQNIKDSMFVAHRKKVTADHLLRQVEAGVYDKKAVEEVIKYGGSETISDSILDYLHPDHDEFTGANDKARKEFLLYECYTKYDINNDGKLEDVIVTVVNNEVLRIDENIYHRPPFFVLSPILEPYKIWGKGFADVINDLQDLKTVLLKQIIINVGLNNDPKMFINEENVNIDDLVDDSSFIRVNGNPAQAVMPFPTQPLAPWSFSFLEYIEGMKENRTGITRYNQGLDAKSLNKTATGISLIMQASNQRLELIARIFSETGIRDLFNFLVELNQRFIDEETVVRLTNEPLIIRPDDLKGEFDLIVNAGVGVGTKETTLQNLMQLLQMYPQLLQLGIATPENVYNVMKKYIETLGFKNVNDFLTNPKEMANATQGEAGQIQQTNGRLPARTENAGANQGLPAASGEMQEADIQRLAEQLQRGMGNA